MTAEYLVIVSYPAELKRDCIMRVPLERFGIQNFI
jgi:hypothetical protein